jgi:hypothetical protein
MDYSNAFDNPDPRVIPLLFNQMSEAYLFERALCELERKHTHRGPNDDEIIDRLQRLRPQRKLLSRSRIGPPGACLVSGAQDVALRVL